MFGAVTVAQIGLGWIFIRWLLTSDRGPKEPRKLLIIAGIFGLLATAGAIALEIIVLPAALTTKPETLNAHQLLGGSILVGLIEEACKSLPLALFLLLGRYIDEVTDGLIYFGITGMIFGVVEDIGYSFSLGPAAGIAKIITGPFIHAGFCVLFGWALASAKIQKRTWLLPLFGFLGAVGFHALYDFGLFYGSGWSILMSLAITLFINLNIFLLYRVARQTDAKLGIAASGENLYCRQCGRPNPHHYLYCVYCGQRT